MLDLPFRSASRLVALLLLTAEPGAAVPPDTVRAGPAVAPTCTTADCDELSEALDAAAGGMAALAGPPDDVGDYTTQYRLFGLEDCYVARAMDDFGCTTARGDRGMAERLYRDLVNQVARCLGAGWARRDRDRGGGKLSTDFYQGDDPVSVTVRISEGSRGWYAAVHIASDE